MEVEKYMMSSNYIGEEEDDEDVPLPGFRFHPTDEELVGFYLRRKVEKRPVAIELIRQIDIYKYDPWDLPKSSHVGEKECYFFCKRGRKYRNSIRPNRVTGSGFWKATGIDRPIYSTATVGQARECIGLKKSLVYYRGSAGKGTKTDWMMHEFRLPAEHDKSTKHIEAKSIAQEAEVWTLCRILKRNGSSYRNKCLPEWKVAAAPKQNSQIDTLSSKTCSADSQNYIISFGAPVNMRHNNYSITDQNKPLISGHQVHDMISNNGQLLNIGHLSSSLCSQAPSSAAVSYSSFGHNMSTLGPDMNELLKRDWDELRSVLELAVDPFF